MPVDPEEAVTASEALRLYTINAPHASNRATRLRHADGELGLDRL
jgi:hypothetical protein